jgi:indolepyruvate ferredoxin oxidoreductase alpha subunit
MSKNVSVRLNILDPEAGTYCATGNDALARAALVSGVRYYATYPGSPITGVADIMLQAERKYPQLHAEISINEAVAVQGATGASWSGARALVSMKHVGLHVCCDPVAYLGYTGTDGGLVLAVGTDPGATCSTGEFDVRTLNDAFHWVMLQPATVAEVYSFTIQAFQLSERWRLPVLLVMPVELCNQHGSFESAAIFYDNTIFQFEATEKYINNGPDAVRHHQELLQKIELLADESEALVKLYKRSETATIGVITSGCNYNAVNEALDMLNLYPVAVLKLGMVYPLPSRRLRDFFTQFQKVIIIDELDGYLAKHLFSLVQQNQLTVNITTLSGDLNLAGALSMDRILTAFSGEFGIEYTSGPKYGIIPEIPERPGTFCPGCPYRGLLYLLQRLKAGGNVYGGDIGCSSLPPYYSDWLTCMGSGMGIAHGVARMVPGTTKVYASMGDSTFFHCGIPVVLNSLAQNTDITLFILDNRWTAMTGHQPLPHTHQAAGLTIAGVVKALGALHVWEAEAYDLRNIRELLMESAACTGVKIIIIQGECRLKYLERRSRAQPPNICKIIAENCHQCGECYRVLGCPAIIYENFSYRINDDLCTSCGVCAQICPNHSISKISLMDSD